MRESRSYFFQVGGVAHSSRIVTMAATSNASGDAAPSPLPKSAAQSPGGMAMTPSGHTQYAMKLPKRQRTGNPDQDASLDAQRECFMTCIDSMMIDPSHILPVFALIQKRKSSGSAGEDQCDRSALLYKLPQHFLVHFITTNSDFSASELMELQKDDDEAIRNVFQFGTQLKRTLRVPGEESKPLEVIYYVLQKRLAEVGDRLNGLSAKMSVGTTKTLGFKKFGVYRLEFDEDGDLNKIKHCSGDEVDVDVTRHKLTRAYKLIDNHSDFEAKLVLEPFPPVCISLFFKALRTGPFKITDYRPTKGGGWAEYFHKHEDDYVKGHVKVDSKASSTTTDTVNQHNVDANREKMQKARSVAVEKMEEKRKKRQLSLQGSI